jgi:hypothetical protein
LLTQQTGKHILSGIVVYDHSSIYSLVWKDLYMPRYLIKEKCDGLGVTEEEFIVPRLEAMSPEQIGGELGVSGGAIRNWLHTHDYQPVEVRRVIWRKVVKFSPDAAPVADETPNPSRGPSDKESPGRRSSHPAQVSPVQTLALR